MPARTCSTTVQAIDKVLGREPSYDWNATWESIAALLREHQSRWRKVEQRLFRDVFTEKDAEAERVRKDGRGTATSLTPHCATSRMCRLKTALTPTFEHEVRPHVPDAWMDRSKDKVGYEIKLQPPLL